MIKLGDKVAFKESSGSCWEPGIWEVQQVNSNYNPVSAGSYTFDIFREHTGDVRYRIPECYLIKVEFEYNAHKTIYRKGDKIRYKKRDAYFEEHRDVIQTGTIEKIDIQHKRILVIEDEMKHEHWIEMDWVVLDNVERYSLPARHCGQSIEVKLGNNKYREILDTIRRNSIYGMYADTDTPESAKEFLNRIYGTGYKQEVHSDKEDALCYGLKTYQTYFDEFINKENKDMKQQQKKRNRNIIKMEKYQRTIKDISFNGPAVIVNFEPTGQDLFCGRFKGDKVVVVCKDGDKYDMKTGFLLAILKEFLNNQSYGNVLEKLDTFDAFDIPQLGKDDEKIDKKTILEEAEKKRYILAEDDQYDPHKFNVGDIVKLKNGSVLFRVTKKTWYRHGDRRINRYRLERCRPNGSNKSRYESYENENRLMLVSRAVDAIEEGNK